MADPRPTVLVLGVGGDVGQGILKALSLGSLRCRVVAACVTPYAVGLQRCDRPYVSPLAADARFLEWLLDVCEREQVRAVLSGVEPVLDVLAASAEHIREATGAVCVVSPTRVLDIGQDKLATSRWLADHALAHPRFAHAADRPGVASLAATCGYPLLAKPRRGRGGRGIQKIHNEAELAPILGDEGMLLQEWCSDEDGEYTVGCFCDSAGALRGSIAMRRVLRYGTTIRADVGEFAPAQELSEQIVAALAPHGPANVQMRMGAGRILPVEINLRFSGTTPARARFGFNEVEAAVRHFGLGEAPADLRRTGTGTVLRYFNEVYLPDPPLTPATPSGLLATPAEGAASFEDWGMTR